MTKKDFEDIIRPLVLLPSDQRKLLKKTLLKNFEKWQGKAITVTHCCESDSEQLCDKLSHNADIMINGICHKCDSNKEMY